MDDKKMLNEKELEKVNGGNGLAWMDEGKVVIDNECCCTCDGEYYKGWVTGGKQMCKDCDYFKNGYCTNKDAWDYILSN